MEAAVKNLICPISTLRINRNVVRITGFMMAAMIALYALTGSIIFVAIIAVDYFIRAFSPLAFSPFSWLANALNQTLNLPESYVDKAPKLFAARVGFLFALATTVLFFINPTVSLIVGLTLMSFALLESVFDICVGCLVYAYLILPVFGRS